MDIGRRHRTLVRMNTRDFPKLSAPVSEIGLGCWQLGGDFGAVEPAMAEAILQRAIDDGITFFDTADVYGAGMSESFVGRVLNEAGRDRFVIASKVGRGAGLYPDGYTRAAVRASVEGSLQRLGIDTMDLIQLHCVPHEVLRQGDVFDTLRELRDEGKIRAFGASVETVEEGFTAMEQPDLASLQVIFNIFRQRPLERLLPAAHERGVAIIVRLPLNSGLLSGKMTHKTTFAAQDHRNYNRDGAAFSVGETFGGIPFDVGVDLAEELRTLMPEGYTMAQFAQRFLLDYEAVTTVITGATRPAQVDDNASVSALAPLSPLLHGQLHQFYKTHVEQHIRAGH